MKARIPKHREFVIAIDEKTEPRQEECWTSLNDILSEYKKHNRSFNIRELCKR